MGDEEDQALCNTEYGLAIWLSDSQTAGVNFSRMKLT